VVDRQIEQWERGEAEYDGGGENARKRPNFLEPEKAQKKRGVKEQFQ